MFQLKSLLLFLLFLFLPSQLGFHFWPAWSYVTGIRVDYLSPTLYLTDILVFGVILFYRHRPKMTLTLLILAIFNLLFSHQPNTSLISWLRLFEYVWLSQILISHSPVFIQTLAITLPLAIIWSSFLAWLQFIAQSSIGGFWYLLGERTFSLSTSSIAKIQLFNIGQILRPYSTFPHSNALAGFLLLCLPLLWHLKVMAEKTLNWKNSWYRLLITSALILAALTIPLTFSRSAIVIEVTLLGTLLITRLRSSLSKPLLLLCISQVVLVVISIGNPISFSDRVLLLTKAQNIIKHYPLQGIGLAGFVAYQKFPLNSPTMNLNFQPVHNGLALLASEVGLPITLLVAYLTEKMTVGIYHKKNYILFTGILVVLATSITDHYWLTSHQNQMLAVVFISLVYIKLAPRSLTK